MFKTQVVIERERKVLRATLNLEGLHMRLYGNKLPSITYYAHPTQEELTKFRDNTLKLVAGGSAVPDAFLPNVEGLAHEKHNLIVIPGDKKGWVLLKIVNLNLDIAFQMKLRHQEIVNLAEEALKLYTQSG